MAHIAETSADALDAKPATEIAAEAGAAVPAQHADLLTPAEAAVYLGMSVATLMRRTNSGQLSCFRLAQKMVRYKRSDLDSYIDSTHSLQSRGTLKEAA